MLHKTFYQTSLIFLFFLLSSITYSQKLTRLTAENMMTETDIYVDNSGVRYSDLVTVKFNSNIFDLKNGIKNAQIEKASKKEIKDVFKSLKERYGEFEIIKVHPNRFWGDTLRTNKRTKNIVRVPDLSQKFKLIFANKVPVDSIAQELSMLSEVKFAEPPVIAYTCLIPNDTQYGNDWGAQKIQAEGAWDITTGNSNITISINDRFGTDNPAATQLHNDLAAKVISHKNLFGDHGTSVAGVAGASTNNSLGVASLGWNLSLRFHRWVNESDIDEAVTQGVDIINFSWITTSTVYADECEDALAQGVVLVAGAGNQQGTIPQVWYPAAHNFGATGQVIAVSGTEMYYEQEKFVDGWNYSPTTNSFIDCAGPAVNIPIPTYESTYGNGVGTSVAAPRVSALVGLLLSIDNTLTVPEIYDIITSSADRIGQYSYDGNNWNRYLGHGRINAHNALMVAQGLPSKPQNLHYTSVNDHPNLIWDANTEANLSGYQIYRSYDGSAFSLRATVGSGTTNYTDTQVDFTKPIWAKEVLYKVRAYNTSTQYSLFSDILETEGYIDLPKKNTAENIKTEFSLDQNFPNPFNPTTIINYNLPQNGFVTLKVYDVLGKEITNLVNETKEAGSYSVEFNASNLPSGVYFYKITAGNFSEIKKMILTK